MCSATQRSPFLLWWTSNLRVKWGAGYVTRSQSGDRSLPQSASCSLRS